MGHLLRVLVVGCGHMGASHARAYHRSGDFQIVGVVSRGAESRGRLSAELGGLPRFGGFEKALEATRPDAVCLATYADTHAPYALTALEAGCHVFVEKPLAETVEQAEAVVRKAQETRRKVVVGYILHVHPAWQRFIATARTLGKPLVMRMNLNQQSSGEEWIVHKSLMASTSPIVDCGVHYVDVMCQMTGSLPVRVHAVGARLSDEIQPGMYNYGHLHVAFEDGSVGWYEAGWGPMMSETAFFVKDVIGPLGSVSMVSPNEAGSSADIDLHTKTNRLRIHFSRTDGQGRFLQPDEILDMSDEPDHQALCDAEQAFFLRTIREDLDLTDHLKGAVDSLRIVLAADQSCRTGQVVSFG
ncbi:MAG: Gfo/Idh/MocA family oxidoreductase [Anaerolineales bacterium]|nr:Gfo/Idh/MocA family oxidoreductase [Anaerolineales bacterium]